MQRAAISAAVGRSPSNAAAALDEAVWGSLRGGDSHGAAALGWATWLVRAKLEAPMAVAELRAAAGRGALAAAQRVLGDAPPHQAMLPRGHLPEVCIAVTSAVSVNPNHRVLVGTPWPIRGSYVDEDDTRHSFVLDGRDTMGRHRRSGRVERVLQHPDPLVLRMALRSPFLSLREVLGAVARRPSTSALLQAAAESDTWIVRAEIREAIAENPFSPTGITLALVPTLHAAVRRRLAACHTVHPLVRQACSEFVRGEQVPVHATAG